MKFHKIGFDFEENKEYVIFVYSYDDMLVFNTGHYFCLEDVKNFHYSDRNEFAYLEKRGITAEMTADEIVARLKELIAEKKALKDAQ